MMSKPFYQSRTFWSIVATGVVLVALNLVAQGFLPADVAPYLHNAEILLTMAGLWYARLGAGTKVTR